MKVVITHGKKTSSKVVIHARDLWDGDHTLSLVILPFLRKYRSGYNAIGTGPISVVVGYPASFVKDLEHPNEELERSEWLAVLDKMIFSFDCIAKKRNYIKNFSKDCYEEQEEHERKIQEGLDLFGHYFRCLWT